LVSEKNRREKVRSVPTFLRANKFSWWKMGWRTQCWRLKYRQQAPKIQEWNASLAPSRSYFTCITQMEINVVRAFTVQGARYLI
jgi:hypothetical protein